MKVLKFGGGCLKDVNQIKKIPSILKEYDNDIIIVVSAFGKLTNLLDEIYTSKNRNFDLVLSFFKDIMLRLKLSDVSIKIVIKNCIDLYSLYKFSHPGFLSIGELVSSQVLSCYLNINNLNHTLFTASKIIKTDDNGVNSTINWQATFNSLQNHQNLFSTNSSFPILTQGFISSLDSNQNFSPTCLGREGSDYTAAVFGHILNANEVILFKDVNGIYSADPKKHSSAKLFLELSYESAFKICNTIKTVVHPKTIKKLEEKRIPLVIKNFDNLSAIGTKIS